jgi:hypothetical protein
MNNEDFILTFSAASPKLNLFKNRKGSFELSAVGTSQCAISSVKPNFKSGNN